MSEPPPHRPPDVAAPAALEYAVPAKPSWRSGVFFLGLGATFLVAVGAGMIVFALVAFSSASSRMETLGSFLGGGVTLIILGAGLVVSYHVSRVRV